ncbi:MAG: carbohydrate-binding domain-containing protein [Blautia sp.]|nr:carbohydrate-binding domain-containing protein [Blautia sp.]
MKKTGKRICLTIPVLLMAVLAGIYVSGGVAGQSGALVREGLQAEFTASDYNDVSGEKADAQIELKGNTGTISDTTRGSSGSTVTIARKGIYRVSGEAENVTILVEDTKESGNVYLILDHVTMTNTSACIVAEAVDQLIIQCVGENTLTSTAPEKAVIFSRDDLTINGEGSLNLISGESGIVCNDTLRITGAVMNIEAENDGLKANDALYMDGGLVNVAKSYEGIEACDMVLVDGEINICASDDGINLSGELEDEGDILVSGGSLYISSGGDGIDSNHSIFIEGGKVFIEGPENNRNSIMDKGDAADAVLSISGGTVCAIGSAEKAKAFDSGTQYARLENISGKAGETISVDDGTGLSFTASQDFDCVIYSSPTFTEESGITIE